MRATRNAILLIMLVFCVLKTQTGCFFEKSDDQKEKECAEQCSKIKELEQLSLFLSGFDSLDVDSVIIREVIPGTDSLMKKYSAHAQLFNGRSRGVTDYFLLEVAGKFPLLHDYLIEIKGEQVHVISNITMGPQPEFAMFDHRFVCGMISYDLDGEKQNDGSMTIRKK